jgi:hypothetical protein
MIGPIKRTYNPGMHPFLPQPVVRFDSDAKLGDEGVTYEFNVKLPLFECGGDFIDWDLERQAHYLAFESVFKRKYPFFTLEGFTGRSGGWLALSDPQGRMTKARITSIQKMVKKALDEFKKDMAATYPKENK